MGSRTEAKSFLIRAHPMTRRAFSAALAGAVAVPGLATGDRSPVVVFTAIAGARLPETLAIRIPAERSWVAEKMRAGLFERRTYRMAAPGLGNDLAAVFSRAGIRPLLQGMAGSDLTYLIPFESLAARQRAWTTLNADPQWTRACHRFQSYHFGLYRAV